MPAKLIRRISPSDIAKEKLTRLDIPGAPAEVVLYDIYGIVNKIRVGDNGKGQWTQFKGELEAVTPEGEIFASGSCFLPQPFEDMLLSQLMQAQEKDDGATVSFAARISLVAPKKGKPSATGYEYRVMPLVDVRESSPLLTLREQAKAALLQLEDKSKTAPARK